MLSTIFALVFAAGTGAPPPPATAPDNARTLVVYYSRSGTTERVAEELAELLGADVERIKDVKGRGGLFGFIRSGYEASRKTLPPILPLERDPRDYDRVILGTPVWAGTMASPMRTYLTQNQGRFRSVALFCTSNSGTEGRALKNMEELCGCPKVAALSLGRDRILESACTTELAAFADAVRSAP